MISTFVEPNRRRVLSRSTSLLKTIVPASFALFEPSPSPNEPPRVSDVLFSVRLLMSKSQLSVVVVVSVQLGMLKTPNERINRAIIP